MSSINIVFAGNHRQYMDWIERQGYSTRDYRYISRPEQLLGLHNTNTFFVGTWEQHSVIKTDEFQIYMSRNVR